MIFSTRPGIGLSRRRRARDTSYNWRSGIAVRPRQGSRSHMALGWEDVRNLQEGVVTHTFMDTTQPGAPFERTVEYQAPFDRCNREEDYAEAWEHFENHKASHRP